MALDPQKIIDAQSGYIKQVNHYQIEADRYRQQAADAQNPVERREHEQAVISAEAIVAEMQEKVSATQAELANVQKEMAAQAQADREAAAEQAALERAEAAAAAREQADAAEAARLKEEERQRSIAALEADLQAHRDRIERGRRRSPGLTPFD